MPLLQALDEGRDHELLEDYAAFRELIIAVYGDIDRVGNAEDHIGRIQQTGSVAYYIFAFNECAAQIDWNESGLVTRFRAGFKDEILDSVATAEIQPLQLHEWMSMALKIDERLWSQRQSKRSISDSSHVKAPPTSSRDQVDRFQANAGASGPVSMELGALWATTALAKIAAERLEYQCQGKYWDCGEVGHVRSKCPTNPSKPLALVAYTRTNQELLESEKGTARD